MARRRPAAVAASGLWTDPDGVRAPSGEVHAWIPGQNQSRCGLQLSRSRLHRFAHLSWVDVQPDTGGHADAVQVVCPRCAAAERGGRRETSWTRVNPRP